MTSLFLMLPCPNFFSDEEIYNINLYSLKEKRVCTINITYTDENFRCVGSSHGWLVFLDQQENPLLFDPFSGTRIRLPPSNTLTKSDSSLFSSCTKIQKVVLSRAPSDSHAKNYAVVVLFSFQSHTKIAFCRGGDEKWSDLDPEGKTYYDVVICEKTNMAFAVGPGPSVTSWELSQIAPPKKMIIQDSCPKLMQDHKFPSDLYSSQWYLALSRGQIFLVVRYIGHSVRYDGKVVCEGDTLTDDAAAPLVCPYKTIFFHVFEMSGDGKKWIKVETLNDLTLFLGGNQSTMLSTIGHPEIERDAIYFTDDYWERMNEDYMYGGHDMGIFKLEDGIIQTVLDFQEQKIEPPPFWIIKSS